MDKFAVLMKSIELQAKELEHSIERGELPRLKPTNQPRPFNSTGSKEVDEAVEFLWSEGLDPNQVTLPPSEHQLLAKDSQAALLFGGLGTLFPVLGAGRGLVGEALHSIQSAADGGKLPGIFQAVFGRGSAPFLDSIKGRNHRFVNGSHDLLLALPEGVRKLGLVRGSLEVSQHLLTDAFGVTGIPIPGSHSLVGHLTPRVLSRYAAFRISDVAASGTTSLLLWLYFKQENIPENSMRRPQMELLAHSTCVGATFLSTALLGFAAAVRSHLNFVSIGAMIASYWKVREMTRQLQASNDARFRDLVERVAALEAGLEQQLDINQSETESRAAARLLDQI